MKKIIDGKMYDTETAELLGAFTKNVGTFNYVHEELYRTKNGRFFVFGSGGPLSRWAQADGSNSWSGGSGLQALSVDYAKQWAGRHMDPDEYELLFGKVEEA